MSESVRDVVLDVWRPESPPNGHTHTEETCSHQRTPEETETDHNLAHLSMSRVQMLVILVLALVMLAVESYVLLPIHRTLAFKQRISTVSVGILSPPEGDSKRDNAMERACIYYLSSLLSSIVPDKSRAQTLVKKGMTYGDFVSLTKVRFSKSRKSYAPRS